MRVYFAVLAIVLLAVAPAFAQDALERGDVLVHSQVGGFIGGWPPPAPLGVFDETGARKTIPGLRLDGARGVLAPSPDRVFAAVSPGVSVWRSGITAQSTWLGALNLHEAGEIVPMRSGDFLITENYRANGRPRVVQFTAAGEVVRVAEWPDPPSDGMSSFLGAAHMDLLSDQCTILWRNNDGNAVRWRDEARRVRRFDICAGQERADLFVLPPGAELGSIRQLPGGQFLVAMGSDVRRFDLRGRQIAVYPVSGRLLALTPDGTGFWAAYGDAVQRVDFAAPEFIAARFTYNSTIMTLAVVGEWRAAMQFPRRRATR